MTRETFPVRIIPQEPMTDADEEKVRNRLELEIRNGDSGAQFQKGYCHETGYLFPRSDEVAALWYEKAAEQGHLRAQCNIGEMYLSGTGVPQNHKIGLYWMFRAAQMSHPVALYHIGRAFLYGGGMQRHPEDGLGYLSRSATQGFTRAQLLLASHISSGGIPWMGEEESAVEAHMWAHMAASTIPEEITVSCQEETYNKARELREILERDTRWTEDEVALKREEAEAEFDKKRKDHRSGS